MLALPTSTRPTPSSEVDPQRRVREWVDEYDEVTDLCCPVCGDPECRGSGTLDDKWYIGCRA